MLQYPSFINILYHPEIPDHEIYNEMNETHKKKSSSSWFLYFVLILAELYFYFQKYNKVSAVFFLFSVQVQDKKVSRSIHTRNSCVRII